MHKNIYIAIQPGKSKMKKSIFAYFVYLLIIFSPLISAEIILNEPKPVYNIGDEIFISVLVSEIKDEPLKLELVCSEATEVIYTSYLHENSVNVYFMTSKKKFDKGLHGICKIIASYGNETQTTTQFNITNLVEVEVALNDKQFMPGASIMLNVNAKKLNGEPVDGIATIKIEGTNIAKQLLMHNGKLKANISLPENMAAGNYLLTVTIDEKAGGEILNTGTAQMQFYVKQVPTEIVIVMEQQDYKPGTSVAFIPELRDQTGNKIDGEITISVEDSNEKRVMEKIVKANEKQEFGLMRNASAGYWSIEARANGLDGRRLFYVLENEEAEFRVINDTLIVENVGNVPYEKSIEVRIGNESYIKDIYLDVGQRVKFLLQAPTGVYDVEITDGVKSVRASNVALTGKAIGLRTHRERKQSTLRYIFAWLFFIGVVVAFMFISARNIRPTLKFRFSLSKLSRFGKRKDEHAGRVIKIKSANIKTVQPTTRGFEALHSLVVKGNKNNACVLAIRIESEPKQEQEKKSLIEEIEKIIEKSEGALYRTQEMLFVIFSPSITKTYKNESKAGRLAEQIAELLNKQEVEFGIAMHTGEIIDVLEGKTLRFTPLHGIFATTRKLARLAKNEILLSETSHRKSVTEIRAEKIERDGMICYRLQRIIDVESRKKFIDDFLKRQQQS